MGLTLWRLKARFYHGLRSLPLIKGFIKKEVEGLKTLLDQENLRPSEVLDVGTGVGSTLEIFSRDVFILGLDRSFNMLQRARRRKRHFTPIVGEVSQLPFKNGAFSFISAIGLVEYIPDKEKLLNEVRRVVCPEGYFLVTIAPPGPLNALRNLLGSRIYPVRVEKWEGMVKKKGLSCIGRKRTLLQVQYLLRAKKIES